MKTCTYFVVFSMALVQSFGVRAVALQDLDRINNLVNQARALADDARPDSFQSPGIGIQSTQKIQQGNPFSKAARAGDASVQSAGGTDVQVDADSIRIKAGGQQFAIPRIGGTRGPDEADPHMAAEVGRFVPNIGQTANVKSALETANSFRIFGDAVRSFRNGDFPLALATIERAKLSNRNNPYLDPFHSLCLFANGDYLAAAEQAYAAASRANIQLGPVTGLLWEPGIVCQRVSAIAGRG